MLFVYLYIIAMYVRPQDWVPGFVGLPTAFLIIPAGVLVGFMSNSRDFNRFPLIQNRLMIIYLGIIFAATAYNEGASTGFEQFVEFLKRVLVYFMIVLNVNTKEKLRKTITWMLLVSAFIAYQAILQGTTGFSWGGMTPYPGYEEIRVRWYGDWDGPNVYGILFVMAAAMALERIAGAGHSLFTRLFNLLLAGAFMWSIFFTNSRGAVLAVLVGIAFYFRAKLWKPHIAAIAVLVLGAALAVAPSRMSEVNSEEESAGERTWLWEQGMNMLNESPLFGVGRNQFARHTDLKLIAHNNYVQNFAELGLPGYFVFIALMWFSFKGSYMLTMKRYDVPEPLRQAGRGLTTLLVGYAAATFFVVMELDLLYLVFGLCGAAYLIGLKECETLPPARMHKFDFQMILAGMAIIYGAIWLAAVKHIL